MTTVRVLVVDDQEPFRLAATAVVGSMDGFEVAGTAASGELAVSAVVELRPDLVLMDINLPGIDGIEATQRLLERAPETVVILLSTYEQSDYGDPASLCGARAYLEKSAFDPDSLRAIWDDLRV